MKKINKLINELYIYYNDPKNKYIFLDHTELKSLLDYIKKLEKNK